MAMCSTCGGTGRVSSSTHANDAYKLGKGWGTHRCNTCNGMGYVQGSTSGGGGGGGAYQLGQGCMLAFTGLFLHPIFAFVGFWLVCTGVLLLLGSMAGIAMGFDMNEPPAPFFVAGMLLAGGVTWSLRMYVHRVMKWTFFLLIGGVLVAFVTAFVMGVMEH